MDCVCKLNPWAKLLLLIYEKEGLTEKKYKKMLGSASFYKAMDFLKEYELIKEDIDVEEHEEKIFLTEDGKEIAEKLKKTLEILKEVDDKLYEIAVKDEDDFLDDLE